MTTHYWVGSVSKNHALATCHHCRNEQNGGPVSLGYWECPCELGQWIGEHVHEDVRVEAWAISLVAKCDGVSHE